MAEFKIVVPKLGESVIEATLTKWLKEEGAMIAEEDPIVEIATDKVDSEIPSPVTGKLLKKLFKEGDVIAVGAVFAIVEVAGTGQAAEPPADSEEPASCRAEPTLAVLSGNPIAPDMTETSAGEEADIPSGNRYYSPLVRNIARRENVTFAELDALPGSGKEDRLTKQDLLNYLKSKREGIPVAPAAALVPPAAPLPKDEMRPVVPGEDRIVEMDRIRQLIAAHMVRSVQTSPHVTSFQEVDMSRVVQWREKNKDTFLKRENEKLTYTPVFLHAIARAVRDFPQVNVSVDGTKIIRHHSVNIGMAVSLPNFNLIVPVIAKAHEKSLLGLVKSVNDLAARARAGKLVPDEISGGTISLTNLGSFGTLMGTPIINQPQTAIVAVGAIKKRVVVVESPDGDTMAIRPVMILSVTYDHRVIDGALGGQFLDRIVHYLETFDTNQPL